MSRPLPGFAGAGIPPSRPLTHVWSSPWRIQGAGKAVLPQSCPTCSRRATKWYVGQGQYQVTLYCGLTSKFIVASKSMQTRRKQARRPSN
jgi:hypothetical protein